MGACLCIASLKAALKLKTVVLRSHLNNTLLTSSINTLLGHPDNSDT